MKKNVTFWMIYWIKKIFRHKTNPLFLIAVFVGVGAGFASVLFRFLLHTFHHIFFDYLYPFLSTNVSAWTLPLIPMFGAVLLIPLSLMFPGEVNGYGMPRFLILVHLKGGFIKARNIFLKMLTSAITIGSGGSAGVEGPIAQIGGAIGSTFSQIFKLNTERRLLLIATGAAAGIAAQFNAPLAGVLFAQEIIMEGEMKLKNLGVLVIASGIATAIARMFFSAAPIFDSLHYNIHNFYEFAFYILLGLIVGVVAVFFIKIFVNTENYFEKLPIHSQIKPIIGALVVGSFGLLHFGVLGDGYSYIVQALQNHGITLATILLLCVLKIFGTAITLGSGNAGGVFAPCLFIGAMLGGSVGHILQLTFPAANINPGSYAFVGMGAFLAAAAQAPMTGIFLLFELTHDYNVILPVMFASVFGVMIVEKICHNSIDTIALSRHGIILHAGREINIMKSILVKDVMTSHYEWLQENITFATFLKMIPESNAQYYPVLSSNNHFIGMLSFHDIRHILREEGLENLIIIKELTETNITKLLPDQSLAEAMEKFAATDFDILPVVHPENEHELLGILNHKDIIIAYNKAVLIRDAQKDN